jgi:hypothetical protein
MRRDWVASNSKMSISSLARELVLPFSVPTRRSPSTATAAEEDRLTLLMLFLFSTALCESGPLDYWEILTPSQLLPDRRIEGEKSCRGAEGSTEAQRWCCKRYATSKCMTSVSLADHSKELSDLDWHIISTDEILMRLSTSTKQGLSQEQSTRRLIEYGKNHPSAPPTHRFETVFGYFFKGFGSILLVGSVLVFVSWKPLGEPAPAIANLALAIVLLAVFFIQAAFNAWQDWSSSRVMASITTMLPDNCLVVRDGNQVEILATEIVPGDILYIKAGNKLPADVRFVEMSSDAKFDRSILTGKSSSSNSIDVVSVCINKTRRITATAWNCRKHGQQLSRNKMYRHARDSLYLWQWPWGRRRDW